MAHNYFWFYKKDIDKVKNIDKNNIKLKNNQYKTFYIYLTNKTNECGNL
jgi:hypothetical protein